MPLVYFRYCDSHQVLWFMSSIIMGLVNLPSATNINSWQSMSLYEQDSCQVLWFMTGNLRWASGLQPQLFSFLAKHVTLQAEVIRYHSSYQVVSVAYRSCTHHLLQIKPSSTNYLWGRWIETAIQFNTNHLFKSGLQFLLHLF